jgi:DNA polymerase III alpha subunit
MGLGQVRELTRKTIAALLDARREGRFRSLDDLLERASPRLAEVENLIKAGGLDGWGAGRTALLADLGVRSPSAPLQLALPLSWAGEAAKRDDTPAEKLMMELEMLGWPVSAHPLQPFARGLAAQGVVQSDVLARHTGDRVTVAGARLGLWGERRGRVVLEDEAGFLNVQMPAGRRLPAGSMGKLGPYRVTGRVQLDRAGEATITAERVEAL